MREQEVANCAWSDFNPSQETASVTKKVNRDLGVEFAPKDYEERTLRLTKGVIAALGKQRTTPGADYLIFANADGKPNGHFLRDLQDLALRARLNCGHCTARRHKSKSHARTIPSAERGNFMSGERLSPAACTGPASMHGRSSTC